MASRTTEIGQQYAALDRAEAAATGAGVRRRDDADEASVEDSEEVIEVIN